MNTTCFFNQVFKFDEIKDKRIGNAQLIFQEKIIQEDDQPMKPRFLNFFHHKITCETFQYIKKLGIAALCLRRPRFHTEVSLFSQVIKSDISLEDQKTNDTKVTRVQRDVSSSLRGTTFKSVGYANFGPDDRGENCCGLQENYFIRVHA